MLSRYENGWPFSFLRCDGNHMSDKGLSYAGPVTNWQLSYEMKHNHLAYDCLDPCLISHGMAPVHSSNDWLNPECQRLNNKLFYLFSMIDGNARVRMIGTPVMVNMFWWGLCFQCNGIVLYWIGIVPQPLKLCHLNRKASNFTSRSIVV